jgi:hypothetical protein
VRGKNNRKKMSITLYEIFYTDDGRRQMMRAGAIAIGCALLIYVGALFATIRSGFFVEQLSIDVRELDRDVTHMELALQQGDAMIVPEYTNEFAQMESVSMIRYVMPDSIAALSVPPFN